MTATPLQPGFPVILGVTGAGTGVGLNGGSVYIGVAGADPEISPQQVWWDAAQTIPASQPLATIGGYITRAGSPAVAYVAADYSMRVRDRAGNQVFYSTEAGTGGEAAFVPYDVFYSRAADGLVASEYFFSLPFVRPVTFAANFAGSRGRVDGNNPGAPYVVSLLKNGISCGSITISAAGAFTFASAGALPVVFTASDRLTALGAVTPDAALSSWSFCLKGDRT
jgi:hypothetical protein